MLTQADKEKSQSVTTENNKIITTTLSKKVIGFKSKRKLVKVFHPVVREEVAFFHEQGWINNIQYVYYNLRLEETCKGMIVGFNVKEFALKLGISKSSVYDTLAKFEKVGLLVFDKTKRILTWIEEFGKWSSVEQESSEEDDVSVESKSVISTDKVSSPQVKTSKVQENKRSKPLQNKDSLKQESKEDKTTKVSLETLVGLDSSDIEEENSELQELKQLDVQDAALFGSASPELWTPEVKLEKPEQLSSVLERIAIAPVEEEEITTDTPEPEEEETHQTLDRYELQEHVERFRENICPPLWVLNQMVNHDIFSIHVKMFVRTSNFNLEIYQGQVRYKTS